VNLHQRIAAGASAATLLVGVTALAPTAHAGEAGALSCYGSSTTYSKPAGTHWLPAGALFWTTGNCTDINIKPKTNRYVKVCFETSSGGSDCQPGYTLALANQWNVIASNVQNGVPFAFEFRSDALSNGSWAA
jgi:hypothetical protein